MVLNKAMIDYLTLTTFDGELGGLWYENHIADGYEEQKRMQYFGSSIYAHGGTWFVGKGKQKDKPHYMLQVSGAAAHVAFSLYRDNIINDALNVSRIDLQLTIEKPEKWKQGDLIVKAERAGLKPRVERSEGKYEELITVYTGTRPSGRMNRTYQKESEEGEQYIRFETEFGRNYSQPVAHALATRKASIQDFINGEVDRRKVVDMFEAFRVGNGKKLPKQRKVKPTTGRERWLLNVVLPCLVAYKNSHECNDDIIRQFREELTKK